jgi:nucleotide-binding universal stress UspA family protein
MLPLHTILHPTDFSERSTHAFGLACALARDSGARLIVLHVLERPIFAYSGVAMAPPPPSVTEEEWTALHDQLEAIHCSDPTVQVEHQLQQGDPAAVILQVAQERNCDLIVLGTHGRIGLERLLLGSVAEKVLRKASCPVLTVKMPLGEAQAVETYEELGAV